MRYSRFWLACILAFLLAGCSAPAPASSEEAFDNLIQIIEQKDIDALEALMAEDFVGDMDRVTTLAWARQAFQRTPRPRITVLSQEKEGDGNRATFRTELLVVAGNGMVPKHSARLRVDTQWQNTPQGWKLRVAQWHRL